MKLKFKHQPFQSDAVAAVCDLFAGQEKQQSTFTVSNEMDLGFLQNDYGIGNALRLSESAILANMHQVQKCNNLPKTDGISGMQFSIEMETGTGKTYVYTKTIYELHRRYGFTKFIVVVPSVAIREGVYKSFEVTREHFALQYDNVPCRTFIYNSQKLSDVRQFATSSTIEVMIINIDAFKKAENIINQVQDRLNGETAMRYIQDTNPIVIIDEPQSVDNTLKAKEAIESLKPLCVLRYSATHRERVNLLYRLTPVDAYQMGLVKQISVSSNQVEDGNNKPYIRLLSVSNENGFKAKIELDVAAKDGRISRKTLTIKPHADLLHLSGNRPLYEGYVVTGIDCTPGFEGIEFENTETLLLGHAIGAVDENLLKRAQIRRTVEAHLEKELRYLQYGVKVLSLFFIDEVKKYRLPDGEKGIYARMFEECYEELMARPKFAPLKERFPAAVESVHNGYFSQDRKGKLKNTRGDTLDDTDTYNTIMRDKEWLLSFDCPLRFIWSHSALREGWDNPNVFQVCTLIEQKSTFTCRQKIGRGLRLCVNQEGERIEDKNINILHVMANESFADFAATLQHELETETGIKFGVLQIGMFTGISYTETVEEEKIVSDEDAKELVAHLQSAGLIREDGSVPEEAKQAAKAGSITLPQRIAAAGISIALMLTSANAVSADALSGMRYKQAVAQDKTVSYEDAEELMDHFGAQGYVAKDGRIKDTMKHALQNGTLDLPRKFEAARERFETIISQADRKPPIRDASRDVTIRLNKRVLLSPEFESLWEKIKQKTTYRVRIDTEMLVKRSVEALRDMPALPKARVVSQTADITIQTHGVGHVEREMRTMNIQDEYSFLPNLLTLAGEECLLKRSTVARILLESGRAQDFLRNPQRFMETFVEIIRNHRHALAIDGIKYIKLDGEEYYAQEIFDSEELMANLDRNAVKVKNSVYDHVIYDSSTVEKPFAVALDNDPDVKMFFKIPSGFKVETPIGTYNPDWAIYYEKDGEKKLYLVLETKGKTGLLDLRPVERLKIECGKRHFEALEEGVFLQEGTDWKSVKMNLS